MSCACSGRCLRQHPSTGRARRHPCSLASAALRTADPRSRLAPSYSSSHTSGAQTLPSFTVWKGGDRQLAEVVAPITLTPPALRSVSNGANNIVAHSGAAGDAPTQPSHRGASPERLVASAADGRSGEQQTAAGSFNGASSAANSQGPAEGSATVGLGLGSVVGAARTQPHYSPVNAQVCACPLCAGSCVRSKFQPLVHVV